MPSLPAVPRPLGQFQSEETGAVSVDWVVLCAVVTAVTLAMFDEVGSALGWHSDGITEELTNSEIVRAGSDNSIGFEFQDGQMGRWSGATVTDIPGFGDALGPIGGSGGYPTVGHDFIMSADVDTSYITFDLYALDSLDDEAGVIYINGEEIGRLVVGHNGVEYIAKDTDMVASVADVVAENVEIGGYRDSEVEGKDYWKDDIVTISIAINDPGDALSFGFGSTANQDTTDEAFAIDNFNISGVDVEATTTDGSETGGDTGGDTT
jgi:Flp pilus assembly pilin Flp